MRKTASRPDGTLADAGPLFALVNRTNEPEQNARCREALPGLALPLVTTLPCFTEAMYLCGQAGEWTMQKQVWHLREIGTLGVRALTDAELNRAATLMEAYSDTPMDMADASLVAVAEADGYTRVFSIDGDFYVYRLVNGVALEVVPGPYRR